MSKILLIAICICLMGIICYGGEAPNVPPPSIAEQVREKLGTQRNTDGPKLDQAPPMHSYKTEEQIEAEHKWREFSGKVHEQNWGWDPNALNN